MGKEISAEEFIKKLSLEHSRPLWMLWKMETSDGDRHLALEYRVAVCDGSIYRVTFKGVPNPFYCDTPDMIDFLEDRSDRDSLSVKFQYEKLVIEEVYNPAVEAPEKEKNFVLM